MATKPKNVETWSDYDGAGNWRLNIKKTRGKLTLEEIREIAMWYEEDFYMLMIVAIDADTEQYYDLSDQGDFVSLYRADDFFKWRMK